MDFSCTLKDLFFIAKIREIARLLLDISNQTTNAFVFQIVVHIGLLMYRS
nr:MAG TPA: hypothetical protein [Caudoviricetes sp.]